MKNNKLLFALSVVYFILLGLYREHLFVNINYQIAKIFYNNSFDYSLPADMKFLESFSSNTLYWGKFPLTLLFSLLYFVPSYYIIRRYYNKTTYNRITVYAYASVFALSLAVFGFGYFTRFYYDCYLLSRFLMGIVQSPLLLMILFSAFKISEINSTAPKR